MKKLVFVIIAIVLTFSVVLAGCGAKGEKGEEISLDIKPEDTSLKYWVMYEIEDVESVGQKIGREVSGPTWYLASGYEPLSYDSNGCVKELPEEYVTYWVGPCPMPSDSKKIISIKITDPDICICGITVDSSEADFEKTFKKLGCEIDVSKLANGDVHIGARKGNVNVGLSKLADGSGYLYVTVDVGYDDDTVN